MTRPGAGVGVRRPAARRPARPGRRRRARRHRPGAVVPTGWAPCGGAGAAATARRGGGAAGAAPRGGAGGSCGATQDPWSVRPRAARPGFRVNVTLYQLEQVRCAIDQHPAGCRTGRVGRSAAVGRRSVGDGGGWIGRARRSGTRRSGAGAGRWGRERLMRGGAGQRKITVRRPCSKTRCSACQRTARANATRSASRPMAARSSGLLVWSTRATSCSMMGPSSRSAVT